VKKAIRFAVVSAAMVALEALGGCASQLQAMSAANTSAVVSVRAAADLASKVAAEQFCTMSVDTLARNTQYVKGVQALCWSGTVTTPSAAADQMASQISAPSGVNTTVIQAPVVTPVPVATPVAVPVVAPAATAKAATVKKASVPKALAPAPVIVPVAAPVAVVPAPVVPPTVPTQSLLSAPVIPK